MCNKEIKFGLFLKKALAEGADYIATGHYAILKESKNADHRSEYRLLKGVDDNKDQSYFLWTLTQEQLKHCLFPVGNYLKPEVRRLAKKFGLPVHDKKDSQGVCFVGELNMKDFLKQYIKPKAGDIKLIENNKIVGVHDGANYYTIGQRHGLNISRGDGPYYVCGKDIKINVIFVTKKVSNLLSKKEVIVEKNNWIVKRPLLPCEVEVKIRYRTRSIPAVLTKNHKNSEPILIFKSPAKAIAPGQSAVFYRGSELIGGGIIA
jgi:tRNA-specific 2-thiouridylase